MTPNIRPDLECTLPVAWGRSYFLTLSSRLNLPRFQPLNVAVQMHLILTVILAYDILSLMCRV